MSFIFREKPKSVVGIDLSSTAVKLVELAKAGSSFRVEAFGVEALPEGAVVEYDIKDTEVVSQCIRKLLKKAKPKTKLAALSLPGSSVITKLIEMDATLFDFEIENQLLMEAEQYIPYSIEEVNLDFDIIGPNEEDPSKNDILIAASQTDKIESLVEAAKAGSAKPHIVDVEAYAVERAFRSLFKDMVESRVVLVDIGATSTTLYVYEQGQLNYIRDQFFGGNQLTEEIQRRYGLSMEESEEAKCNGKLPEGYYKNVLKPFKEVLIQQIERSLQFYFSSASNKEIDLCFLCGGGASIEGLAEDTEIKIKIPTFLANPTQKLTKSKKALSQGFDSHAPSAMTAIGLAMRSFG